MCKLAYVSNIANIPKQKKHALFKAVQSEVTRTERSGYGVASKTRDGSIQTFRTLDVNRNPAVETDTPPFCYPNTDGQIDIDAAVEVIFHGRTSTNSVSIPNTHPFSIGQTVLCHNGVLTYRGEDYDKQTDNDTEDLTYHFDKYGLDNIDGVFTGYAAWIAFKAGKTYVARDSRAPLYYSHIKSLDCHVFATSQATVSRINRVLGAKRAEIFQVTDNTMTTFQHNTVVDVTSWSGLRSSSYANSMSYLSLGTEAAPSTPSQPDLTQPSMFSDYVDDRENLKRFYTDEQLVHDCEAGVLTIKLDGKAISASQYMKLDADEQDLCEVFSNYAEAQ